MWASRLASLAIHAALIGAAIRFSEPGVREAGATITPVPTIFTDPGRPAPPAPPAPGSAFPVSPVPPLQFDPTIVPNVIPPVGANLPGTFLPPGDPGLPGSDTLRLLPGGSPVVAAVIDAVAADEAPRLLWHPALHYPEVLRQAGIEGRIVVEVVLDTAGRAERGSLRIASGGHALFEEQARALVEASRYAAARHGGRAVRVRVLVPVVFSLRR